MVAVKGYDVNTADPRSMPSVITHCTIQEHFSHLPSRLTVVRAAMQSLPRPSALTAPFTFKDMERHGMSVLPISCRYLGTNKPRHLSTTFLIS